MATKRAVHIRVRHIYPDWDSETGGFNGDETTVEYIFSIEHLALRHLVDHIFSHFQFAMSGSFDAPTSPFFRIHLNTLLTGEAATMAVAIKHINNWASSFINYVETNGAFSFYTPGSSGPTGFANVEKISAFPDASLFTNVLVDTKNWITSGFTYNFICGNGTGDTAPSIPVATTHTNDGARYFCAWLRRSVALLSDEDYSRFVTAWKACIAKTLGSTYPIFTCPDMWWNDKVEYEITE